MKTWPAQTPVPVQSKRSAVSASETDPTAFAREFEQFQRTLTGQDDEKLPDEALMASFLPSIQEGRADQGQNQQTTRAHPLLSEVKADPNQPVRYLMTLTEPADQQPEALASAQMPLTEALSHTEPASGIETMDAGLAAALPSSLSGHNHIKALSGQAESLSSDPVYQDAQPQAVHEAQSLLSEKPTQIKQVAQFSQEIDASSAGSAGSIADAEALSEADLNASDELLPAVNDAISKNPFSAGPADSNPLSFSDLQPLPLEQADFRTDTTQPLHSQLPPAAVSGQDVVEAAGGLPAGLNMDPGSQALASMLLLSRGSEREMRLRLYPDHLGTLRVHLVSRPDGLSAQILADRPETCRLLEQSVLQLQQALVSRQIDCRQIDVVYQPDFQSEWQATASGQGQTADDFLAQDDQPQPDTYPQPREIQSARPADARSGLSRHRFDRLA